LFGFQKQYKNWSHPTVGVLVKVPSTLLAGGFSDLTGRVNPLGIDIEDDFCKHLWMLAVSPAARIGSGKDLVV
jgi:hypothetical protein